MALLLVLLLWRELTAKGINKFLVLTAEECPLKELVTVDKASSVRCIDLTTHDCLQYLEDLASHFPGLADRELEEEHADVAIDTLRLGLLL